MSTGLRIREAEPADVELIFSLIVELADYERAPDRVIGTPDRKVLATPRQELCV